MIFFTILTGRRPHLLARTLRSLERFAPTQNYLVCHNGADPDTIPVYLSTTLSVKVEAWNDWLGIGEATTRCADYARESGAEFWCHLEDDWELRTPPRFGEAKFLLRSQDIGQVRLRSLRDRTLPYHYITRQPTIWDDYGSYRIGDTHLTFNPALWRTADLDLFPVTDEPDAMRRSPYTHNAQLDPGHFVHIGKGHSLR